MKYDKNAILNTAQNLRFKSSGLSVLQTKLSRISPMKCSSSFYAKRSSLVCRLSNVQSEINSLSCDIGNAANKMSSDEGTLKLRVFAEHIQIHIHVVDYGLFCILSEIL